jgi:hypothetical protein
MCMLSAGTISRARTAPPASADTHLPRYTNRAHVVHGRLAEPSVRSLGQSSRGPAVARMTGNSVIATATDIRGTNIPAKPVLRRNLTGSATKASSPTATVRPEKTTDRPARAMVASMAA